MLTIYEQYRKVCYNSIVLEQDITEQEMLEAIDLSNKNRAYCLGKEVPPPSKKDVDAYDRWREKRRVTSLSDLSDDKRDAIIVAMLEYERKHGKLDKVYLSGSHTAGTWLDIDSPKEDRAIRRPIKPDKPQSDIDLIPHPFFGHEMFGLVDFSSVPKGRKILIYENGNYVF